MYRNIKRQDFPRDIKAKEFSKNFIIPIHLTVGAILFDEPKNIARKE